MTGPPGQRVIGGQQVDGAAHEVGPYQAAPAQQVREDGRVERAQPRPEPDERLLRLLCLHAAQVRDGVEDRYVGAIEQQLAGERGAAQRPVAENGHRVTAARSSAGRRRSAARSTAGGV
ncbi:hypothetical protein GCM10009680_36610 [Streptomyces yatensis]|uniref:Uncharacterized protein n=1 Tax=Streptomyces yatensis TaxID=155177 RepID=A0ABN2HV09_9ACTN